MLIILHSDLQLSAVLLRAKVSGLQLCRSQTGRMICGISGNSADQNISLELPQAIWIRWLTIILLPRRLRSDDAYTPGGKSGFRPDYPTIVYTKILKELYPDVPVVIGGIEASMRRLTHYDYWKDKLEPSILVCSEADMLVYGMGEQPLRELMRLLLKGVPFASLKTIPQTAICN